MISNIVCRKYTMYSADTNTQYNVFPPPDQSVKRRNLTNKSVKHDTFNKSVKHEEVRRFSSICSSRANQNSVNEFQLFVIKHLINYLIAICQVIQLILRINKSHCRSKYYNNYMTKYKIRITNHTIQLKFIIILVWRRFR